MGHLVQPHIQRKISLYGIEIGGWRWGAITRQQMPQFISKPLLVATAYKSSLPFFYPILNL